MQQNPNLNKAFKWAIENSAASGTPKDGPKTEISSEILEAVFSPVPPLSEADMMKLEMEVIENTEAETTDRVQALENFTMIIEQLDNANNMEPLGMWTPLIAQLESEHADIRQHAALCCGVAVQNNLRTQERLLIVGAIPTLMRLATSDPDREVRKKAATALSCEARNFQPGLDEAIAHAPAEFKPKEKLDANDMESVDILINKIRESI